MRIRCLLFLSLLLGSLGLQAQATVSENGRFRVDYVRGCAPFTITVVEEIDQSSDVRQYGIQEAGASGNPSFTTQTTFTVNEPGSYELVQIMGSGGDASFDKILFEVYEPAKPVFEAFNCGNGELQLQIAEDGYDFYTIILDGTEIGTTDPANPQEFQLNASGYTSAEISVRGRYSGAPDGCGESSQQVTVQNSLPPTSIEELTADVNSGTLSLRFSLPSNVRYVLEIARNGGLYQALQEVSGVSELSLSGYDFSTNYYCLRFSALNQCQQTSQAGDALCTVQIQAEAESARNVVNYQTASQSNQVLRISNDLQTLLETETAWSGSLSEPVSCGENRCYTAEIQQGNALSITGPFCIQNSQSGSPPPPTNIATHWEGETASLVILDPAAQQAQARILWDESGLNSLHQRSDSLVEVPDPINCYRMQYTDGCGNRSELSHAVCPLYIQRISGEPDALQLSWQAYEGYADGILEYQLERISPDGSSSFLSLGLDLRYEEVQLSTPDNGTRYRLWAIPQDENLAPSFSNEIVFELIITGYFPNAFSPDGKGNNESFGILGKFVRSGRLRIYDRWGQIIFQTEDIRKGWSGTFANGQPAPPGPYIYQATYETTDDRLHETQGTVVLIR